MPPTEINEVLNEKIQHHVNSEGLSKTLIIPHQSDGGCLKMSSGTSTFPSTSTFALIPSNASLWKTISHSLGKLEGIRT